MGIMDKVAGLLPRRSGHVSGLANGGDAVAMRDGVDRWLHRLVDEPWTMVGAAERFAPSIDVRETPDQVIVTVEVPGLAADEVELSVVNGALVVRGEKREATTETRDDVHVAELRYGSFVRSIPLPRSADPDGAEAQVKNGIVTVRFPKTSRSAGRIPVRT